MITTGVVYGFTDRCSFIVFDKSSGNHLSILTLKSPFKAIGMLGYDAKTSTGVIVHDET